MTSPAPASRRRPSAARARASTRPGGPIAMAASDASTPARGPSGSGGRGLFGPEPFGHRAALGDPFGGLGALACPVAPVGPFARAAGRMGPEGAVGLVEDQAVPEAALGVGLQLRPLAARHLGQFVEREDQGLGVV